MKISIKLLFLFLIILSFSQLVVSQSKLKLLTFNIWDPGDKVYWDKLGGYPVDSLIKYLTEDGADMIMLQEVTLEAGTKNQVYARVKKRLEAKGYLYSAFYRPDYSKGVGIVGYIQGMENSGYPLAIFSKFPVYETFAMQTMNKKTIHKGVLGLRIQFNNKTLYVFNTHLGTGLVPVKTKVKKNLWKPYNLSDHRGVYIEFDLN